MTELFSIVKRTCVFLWIRLILFFLFCTGCRIRFFCILFEMPDRLFIGLAFQQDFNKFYTLTFQPCSLQARTIW